MDEARAPIHFFDNDGQLSLGIFSFLWQAERLYLHYREDYGMETRIVRFHNIFGPLGTRSFCYIDDCVEGLYKLMQSDYPYPLNLGQDRLVTIDQLADMIAEIAGICIIKKHVPGPQGVRGRNSDNTRLRQVLGWEPEVSLEEGLSRTYAWIEKQVRKKLGL